MMAEKWGQKKAANLKPQAPEKPQRQNSTLRND
jgi:hypothetical protein